MILFNLLGLSFLLDFYLPFVLHLHLSSFLFECHLHLTLLLLLLPLLSLSHLEILFVFIFLFSLLHFLEEQTHCFQFIALLLIFLPLHVYVLFVPVLYVLWFTLSWLLVLRGKKLLRMWKSVPYFLSKI